EHGWLRRLYGFALKPDLVLYLKVSIEELLARVLASGGFDYWESGMDHLQEPSMYEAFVKHQTALLREFDKMTTEFGFTVIDANRSIRAVFADLQAHVEEVVRDMTPAPAQFTDFVGHVIPVEEPRQERRSVAEALRDLAAAQSPRESSEALERLAEALREEVRRMAELEEARAALLALAAAREAAHEGGSEPGAADHAPDGPAGGTGAGGGEGQPGEEPFARSDPSTLMPVRASVESEGSSGAALAGVGDASGVAAAAPAPELAGRGEEELSATPVVAEDLPARHRLTIRRYFELMSRP
ncbi:MAG: hypothetical protein N2322_05030, partial [Terrimicrobiaceae bacterium]|nr:hypothetical protein [Terrimicrobiaceae bacterium]